MAPKRVGAVLGDRRRVQNRSIRQWLDDRSVEQQRVLRRPRRDRDFREAKSPVGFRNIWSAAIVMRFGEADLDSASEAHL